MASKKRLSALHPLDWPTRQTDVGAALVAGLGIEVPALQHELGEAIDEVCDLSGRAATLEYPEAYKSNVEALRHAYYVLKQVIRDARAVYDETPHQSAAAKRLAHMYKKIPKEWKHEQPENELRLAQFFGYVKGAFEHPLAESEEFIAELFRGGAGRLHANFRTLSTADITRALAENSALTAAATLIIAAKAFGTTKFRGRVDADSVEKVGDRIKKAERRSAKLQAKRGALIVADIERDRDGEA